MPARFLRYREAAGGIISRAISRRAGARRLPAGYEIAEGSGVLAPRISFVPVRGQGKVHVGYFGPHKNVPNTLA